MAIPLENRDATDLRPASGATETAPRGGRPTHREIAEAAYFLWEASFHDSDPDAYWLQAERDLLAHSIERERLAG